MQVSEAIRTKRAVRQFTSVPVPEDIILKIVDAGRRSQSSKNTQPWQFVVIRDRAKLEALSHTGDYASHLAGAAFAIALIGLQDTVWNMFDLGQASSYMQLAAWELGVGSCIATIFRQDEAKPVLGIPADRTFYLAISFGYPSAAFKPAKMGGRKAVEDVVRWDSWA